MINVEDKRVPHQYRNKYLQRTAGGVYSAVQSSASASVDLSSKLDKSVWDANFEELTDPNGNDYLYLSKPIVMAAGAAMYAGNDILVPSIFEGLPLDETTIGWNNGKLSVLGDIGGGISSAPVTGSGNAITGATLSADGKVLSLVKGATFLTEHQSLAGYAKASDIPSLKGYATESWVNDKGYLVASSQDKTNWNAAFGWGDHATAGYAKSSDLANYTTLDTAQTITGAKTFSAETTAFKGITIGGVSVKKSEDGVLILDGNLLITGGVTMHALGSRSAATIMDGVLVDGTTIVKENGKLVAIGGGSSVDMTTVWTALAANTSEQINVSHIPSLNWSKIGSGKPTALSGYGITDAVTTNTAQDITANKKWTNGYNVTTITTTGTITIDTLTTGGWARALEFYGNSSLAGMFGAYGSGSSLNWMYVGTTYSNPWQAWNSNGTTFYINTLIQSATYNNNLHIYRNVNGGAAVIGYYNNTSKTFLGTIGFVDANTPIWYKTDNSTRVNFLHALNYDSYALPLTGGTLTGVLRVNEINAVDGNGMIAIRPASWTGVTSSQFGVGTVAYETVIRSSNANLLHYKHGYSSTPLVILDASNYTDYPSYKLASGSFSNASDINFNFNQWLSNGGVSDVPSMSYAALFQIGNSYSRGWQIWSDRNTKNIYWRSAKNDMSGWESVVYTLIDSNNFQSYPNNKVGYANLWMYPENNNEINFGGTNASTTIYFGYRAKDSRTKPTDYYFGTADGIGSTANIYSSICNSQRFMRAPYVLFKNYNDNGDAGYVGRGASSSNTVYLQGYTGNAISIGANRRDNDIFITTGGSIGMGTLAPSPSYKLHVIGDVNFAGAIVGESIELYRAQPFIDFHFGSSTADYTSRIIEEASGRLAIKGRLSIGYVNESYSIATSSFICSSWVRTTGSAGWYSETYGGGWHMADSTWIRSYNNKALLLQGAANGYGSAGFNVGLDIYNSSYSSIEVFGGSTCMGLGAHSNGSWYWWYGKNVTQTSSAGKSYCMSFNGTTWTFYGNMLLTGGATMHGSDITKKNVLSRFVLPLNKIANAPLIRYRWKDNRNDLINVGGSAQYTNDLLPECAYKIGNTWSMDYATTAYAFAVSTAAHLANYIKIQATKEDFKDIEIRELKRRIEILERRTA